MTHFQNRTEFLSWLADNVKDPRVQRALDKGETTIWGLFKGGYVVETQLKGKSYLIGIKPINLGQQLICGLIKSIPFQDYIGGDTDLKAGDYPEKSRAYMQFNNKHYKGCGLGSGDTK